MTTTTLELPKEGKRKLNREEKAEKEKKTRRKKEKIQLIMIDSRGRRRR